jgi:hypothetical protein
MGTVLLSGAPDRRTVPMSGGMTTSDFGKTKYERKVILMVNKNRALKKLDGKVEELAYYLERMRLAEYIQLFNRPWRLMWLNFLAGLARGVGIAVGGTLTGRYSAAALEQVGNSQFAGDRRLHRRIGETGTAADGQIGQKAC